MASPFTTASSADMVVTIDLTQHPPNLPLGMLLAPGAGGGTQCQQQQPHLPTPSSVTGSSGGETFGTYFSSYNSNNSPLPHMSPTASNVVLVAGWEHDNGGLHLGPIQRSGLVRLGDRLVRINGRDVTDWTFREVMDALKELVSSASSAANTASVASSVQGTKRRLKTLGFAPSGTPEWSRGTHPTSTITESMFFGLFHHSQQQSNSSDNDSSAHVVHSKRRYSFVSFVGRWRVATESLLNHENAQQQPRLDEEDLQHQRHHSELSNEDGQQQLRQDSESSCELERQLNKEPSIKYREPPLDDDIMTTAGDSKSPTTTTAAPTTTSADIEKNPHVQYEIQCHMLFRNPSSFQSHATAHPYYGNPNNGIIGSSNNLNNNNNMHHRSWSVWKRYTELQTLDEELRRDFGWQMDALDDGRGIVFPSPHGLESWWYGFRNRGGVVTSLMGGSSGVDAAGGVSRDGENVAVGEGKEESDNTLSVITNKSSTVKAEKGDDSWGNSFVGLLRKNFSRLDDSTAKVNNNTNPAKSTIDDLSSNKNVNESENNSHSASLSSSNNCPFPASFVEKRQKELASYWTNLMRIEDIFEFGDMTSHKFGKTMAAFLEVDRVLLSRKFASAASTSSVATGGSHNQMHQQHQLPMSSKIAFPAINENESTDVVLGPSFRPSFATSNDILLPPGREVSGLNGAATTSLSDTATRELSGMTIQDDDVSLLSDGTGAFGDRMLMSHHVNRRSPQRPVVDVVPRHYSNGSGGEEHDAMIGNATPEKRGHPMSSLSVADASSSSIVSGNRRRSRARATKAPRAKPAFQRQFLPP